MKRRLNDKEYGRALDNLVIGCVDVAVIHNNEILLERRQSDPIRGELWIFGGRILIGEELAQTAQRSVRRELGIDASKERFHQLGVFNLRWSTRREQPSANGCHHLLVAHLLELNDTEREQIDAAVVVRPQETSWFDIDEPDVYLLEETEDIIQTIKTTRIVLP